MSEVGIVPFAGVGWRSVGKLCLLTVVVFRRSVSPNRSCWLFRFMLPVEEQVIAQVLAEVVRGFQSSRPLAVDATGLAPGSISKAVCLTNYEQSFSTVLRHLIDDISRCSHGALPRARRNAAREREAGLSNLSESLRCGRPSAPTERGDYSANIYEAACRKTSAADDECIG